MRKNRLKKKQSNTKLIIMWFKIIYGKESLNKCGTLKICFKEEYVKENKIKHIKKKRYCVCGGSM